MSLKLEVESFLIWAYARGAVKPLHAVAGFEAVVRSSDLRDSPIDRILPARGTARAVTINILDKLAEAGLFDCVQ